MFIRADVDDCPVSAKEFQIEVLPSVVIIEQQLRNGGRYDETVVLDIQIGQKIENINDSVKSWYYGNLEDGKINLGFVNQISMSESDKEIRWNWYKNLIICFHIIY